MHDPLTLAMILAVGLLSLGMGAALIVWRRAVQRILARSGLSLSQAVVAIALNSGFLLVVGVGAVVLSVLLQ
ncbi:putative RND superfamily exporter protein [Leifsonia sp. 563]